MTQRTFPDGLTPKGQLLNRFCDHHEFLDYSFSILCVDDKTAQSSTEGSQTETQDENVTRVRKLHKTEREQAKTESSGIPLEHRQTRKQ